MLLPIAIAASSKKPGPSPPRSIGHARLSMSRQRHDDRWRLRRFLEIAGGGAAGVPAGVAALLASLLAMAHWLPRGADEPPLDSRSRLCCSLSPFSAISCFHLHAVWRAWKATAISAGVIMAGIPAAVALLSWLARNAVAPACWPPSRWRSPASSCSLSPAGPDDAHTLGARHGAAGWAVFCEASYVVIGKRLTGNLSPRRISALINLWGLILVTPFGLWAAWSFDFGAVSGNIWLGLVLYALAASMWTVWLWMTGAQAHPGRQGGVFTVFCR